MQQLGEQHCIERMNRALFSIILSYVYTPLPLGPSTAVDQDLQGCAPLANSPVQKRRPVWYYFMSLPPVNLSELAGNVCIVSCSKFCKSQRAGPIQFSCITAVPIEAFRKMLISSFPRLEELLEGVPQYFKEVP